MSNSSNQGRTGSIPRYQPRRHFMTDSEVAAYDVLSSVFDTNIIVCPKVRLAELVSKFKPEEHQIQHWSKLQLEKVDFLICARPRNDPILAIKIATDSNIKKRQSKGRDTLDDVLEDIGIPLLRLRARKEYKHSKVANLINVVIQENQIAGTVTSGELSELDVKSPSVDSILRRSLDSTLKLLVGIKDVYHLRAWRPPNETPN